MTSPADLPAARSTPRTPDDWRGLRVLFVTGRLAEGLVRRTATAAAAELQFQAEVRVLGISVAALMHVDWVRRKLTVDREVFDLVVLPGWCDGDLSSLETEYGRPVIAGPKEILDLPQWLGRGDGQRPTCLAMTSRSSLRSTMPHG